jgi:hypothetical protein
LGHGIWRATISPTGQAKLNFPENGFNGNTTNWHHYAATFSAGTVVLYFDGQPVSTNVLPVVTQLTLSQSPSRAYDWIGIGANPHVGTPELENETGEDYPNNGWMNGVIDDVRIYNRALVAGEIEAIVSGEEYSPSAGTLAFSASTYTVSESGGTATITVTRTSGTDGAVGVNYATSNGTATSGSDYTATSGTLSWSDGESTSKTFNVTITSDVSDESDETVTLTLSSATGGAALGTSSATLTITDDDEGAAQGHIRGRSARVTRIKKTP